MTETAEKYTEQQIESLLDNVDCGRVGGFALPMLYKAVQIIRQLQERNRRWGIEWDEYHGLPTPLSPAVPTAQMLKEVRTGDYDVCIQCDYKKYALGRQ